MFFIASSGRAGTLALTRGLDTFSDHRVAHEPDPLLEEGWAKHRGLAAPGDRLADRLALYARLEAAGEAYGESIRTPNLLPEFLDAVPEARLLVIVRDPLEWVRSAHRRRVLRKGDEWDRYRLMPSDDHPEQSLALRLAGHWCVVNRYLLAAAEGHRHAAVVLHQSLECVIADWSRFLGVGLVDRPGLSTFLATRPNHSAPCDEPENMEQVAPACAELWGELLDATRRLPVGVPS